MAMNSVATIDWCIMDMIPRGKDDCPWRNALTKSFESDILKLQASIEFVMFLRVLRIIKPTTASSVLAKLRWSFIVTELNQSVYENMKNYDTEEEAIEAWLENT